MNGGIVSIETAHYTMETSMLRFIILSFAATIAIPALADNLLVEDLTKSGLIETNVKGQSCPPQVSDITNSERVLVIVQGIARTFARDHDWSPSDIIYRVYTSDEYRLLARIPWSNELDNFDATQCRMFIIKPN